MCKVRLETLLTWIVVAATYATMLMSLVVPDLPPFRPWGTLSFLIPLALVLLSVLESACPATIWVKTRMTMPLLFLWFASALVLAAVFAIASRFWLNVISLIL
jgi:hypothetical protein